MSLKQYIIRHNRFVKVFNPSAKVLHIDKLTVEDMQQIAEQLASELSPESLTCDGELRGKPLIEKRSMLNRAVSELQQLGQPVKVY